LEPDIVDRKTALQLRSLPHTCLPNMVNFGSQMAKMGPFFNPLKINFLDAHISRVKGRCSLNISQF